MYFARRHEVLKRLACALKHWTKVSSQ